MERYVIAVLVAVVTATSTACGSANESTEGQVTAAAAGGNRISGYGMSVELPSGWSGRILKRDAKSAPLVRAANFPVYLGTTCLSLCGQRAEMPKQGIFIELADLELPLPEESREGWIRTALPVEIRRSDFGRFEGAWAPGFALRNLVINGRSLMIGVGFGTSEPSEALLAEANRVLATLEIDPDRSAWGGDDAYNTVPLVSLEPPNGWFTAETSLDRLIPVAWAGNVPFIADDPADDPFPDRTVRSLPADGIVIEAVGPRPYTGGEDFPRLSFPLELSDGYFQSDGYKGQPAPNVSRYHIDTWVDEELLNVTVWLGRNEPTREMIDQANGALATLSIAR